MGGTNKNRKKKRNVFGDSSWGQLYLGPIPKIPSRQPLAQVKGVGEDELDGDNETLLDLDKQPQFKRQKSINVIECQYEQEPFDDEDVLCKLDGDDEKDLYNDEDHASNDTESPVIFYKSSKDIMESYFSVYLDELNLKQINIERNFKLTLQE